MNLLTRVVPLFCVLLTLFNSSRGFGAERSRDVDAAEKPLFAAALAPGDTIQIVAPAANLTEKPIQLAKQSLEKMGFEVRMPADGLTRVGYFSASDENRAAELMRAFCDPHVKAIFPGTGGYGTTRIVDRLDYDVIRRNPKILIGFSDITGLHLAINRKTGLVTFHSPNPEWGLGSEGGFPKFESHWFWRAVLQDDYKVRGKLSGQGYSIFAQPSSDAKLDSKLFDQVPRPVALRPGIARGRLIGGNLSVIHALMGTPYEIQTDGKILFIEDIGEAPYRVDRMLNTLRLAGKFERLHGVILGQFSAREGGPKEDAGGSMDEVLRDYFNRLNVPVVANFPIGHTIYNATFPVGALAELDAEKGLVRILENPVKLPAGP